MSRMKGPEVIAEFEWLIENGCSPLMAAQQLGRSSEALSRMFYRYGRGDLAALLDRYRFDRWAS